MRAFAIVLCVATIGLSPGVRAQQQDQSPGSSVLRVPQVWNLTPEDKQAYCFWSGQIFSLGASFCSRQQSSLTCTEWPGKRPIWVIKDNDKACDKNPSLAPL
ncbi:MAG TPA: hypothetical protein VMG58_15505 [Candidatus Sulfotelmatobacter sp.]|nr:hypothetical protein [Candidatus Sulfotelmatobacter sp.]